MLGFWKYTIVRPPSSVLRRATNPPAPADQFPLLVSRPSVPYAGLHPPPTCAAGGTWIGCGCGGEGDGAPRGGLESVVSSEGITSWVGKLEEEIGRPEPEGW